MASFDANFLVLDLETGGLSFEKNPILEIGCVAINNNLEDIGQYQSLIKPYDSSKKIEEQALKANGLTLDEVNKGKDSKIVIQEFIDFLKKLKKGKELPIVVGHNIDSFDLPFLDTFFTFHKEDLSKYLNAKFTIDTMWWSRLRWQESVNYKLTTCAQNCGVDLVNAHRAMTDVQANKGLLKHLIKNLRAEGQVVETSKKRFRENFKFQF